MELLYNSTLDLSEVGALIKPSTKSGHNKVDQVHTSSGLDPLCQWHVTLHSPVTSATVIPALEAASRSTWSLPMPAVSASFSFGALAMRSGVR